MARLKEKVNTLAYDLDKCSGCGLCADVCPHGVFEMDGRFARMADPEACIECGACSQNCPTAAISVNSGVGCATAMILTALLGRKVADATCN